MALSPTERLLIALSRVRPEPTVAATELIGVDFERLLLAATKVGNFALIARRLLDLVPGLPEDLRGRTERNLNHGGLREVFGLGGARDLALRLAALDEPVLLLKGAAYTRFIYPRPGLRSFLDVDVLVRRRAVDAARSALLDLGFTVTHEIDGSIDLVRYIGDAAPPIVIELHTELVHHHEYPYYRADLAFEEERLLERSEARDLDGAPVRILRAEDELLYSVLHFFFHHDLAGLKYHSDLNALLTDPARPIDVAAAVRAARAARAEHAVGLALAVQADLFGLASVAADLLAELRPRGLRRALLARVLPPVERIPLTAGRVAGHPAKILVAPGLLGPLRLAFRWLFPGKRYLMSIYHLNADNWRGGYHLRYSARVLKNALSRRFLRARPVP